MKPKLNQGSKILSLGMILRRGPDYNYFICIMFCLSRLHVRRTDKIGTEASFHALKEYMNHAEEYFSIKEKAGQTVQRRVFIASDDASVISEAKRA
jgi:hypothetical protein